MRIYKFPPNLFVEEDKSFSIMYSIDIEPKYLITMNSRELGSYRKHILLADLSIEILSESSIYNNIYNLDLKSIILDFLPLSLRSQGLNYNEFGNSLKVEDPLDIGFYTKEVFGNTSKLVNRIISEVNKTPDTEEEGIKNVLLLAYTSQIVKFKKIVDFTVGRRIIEDISTFYIKVDAKRLYYNHLSSSIKEYLSIIKA